MSLAPAAEEEEEEEENPIYIGVFFFSSLGTWLVGRYVLLYVAATCMYMRLVGSECGFSSPFFRYKKVKNKIK